MDNIYEMIADAMFTYFGIDPKYCDDRLLMTGGSTKEKNRKEIFEFVATPNLRKAVA